MDPTSDLPGKVDRFAPRLAGAPTSDAILRELDKILASQAFRSAASQREFLRYTLQEVVAGRGNLIKEYMIGMEALGRGESFDPRLDPIVRTQASKLRARLAKYYESDGADDPLIIEFPKGSYVPSFRVAGAAVQVLPTPSTPAIPATLSPSRGNIAAIGLAVFVLVGSVAVYLGYSESRPTTALADSPSIAVLPFVNAGGKKEDEFLSDGLTEELIDSLARVPWLQVVARTSSFRFKGKALDSRKIGQTLNVRTLLEGSVHKSGNRLRIAVQLDSAADGAHLWSGSYDREASDAKAIQLEIARAVIDVLGVKFAQKGREDAFRASPELGSPNPSAYKSYLKGRYFWNKLTAPGLKTAIQYFEQAIAEDPSFARAYTALADSYVMAPQVTGVLPDQVVAKIRGAATKALELDGGLGEPHFDLAICAEYEFDWATAEKEFKKGLELSPANAVGRLWYAKYLAITGRRDAVLVQRRIAAELDPVSPYAVQAVAGYYSVTGRYNDAIELFRSALALEPNFGLAHQGLGIAYLLKGMPADALVELQEASRLMGGHRRMALLGYAYGVAGRRDEAHRILDDLLKKRSRHEPVSALSIAGVYIGLGDKDRAFEWLEKAIDERDLDVTLQWDSLYDSLRSDPRYLGLLRRMKLA